jgi:hypothetical protein
MGRKEERRKGGNLEVATASFLPWAIFPRPKNLEG